MHPIYRLYIDESGDHTYGKKEKHPFVVRQQENIIIDTTLDSYPHLEKNDKRYLGLTGCIKWWGNRKESELAWKVKAETVLANNFNLDIKNPNAKEEFEHMPPEQLVEDIMKKEERIAGIMAEIKQILGRGVNGVKEN